MSQLRLVALVAVVCAACASSERTSTVPSAPMQSASDIDDADFSVSDLTVEPSGDPPRAWVFDPAVLSPEMPQSASNCDLITFPFPPTVQPYLHPYAVCRQREWGQSGIVRQQGHGIHVTTLPRCNGGPGDIAEIRLCKVGWANQQTTWGKAGPRGCVGVEITPTCET